MKNNLIPIYLKEALEKYPWVSKIILSYPNQKSFHISHRTAFTAWLRAKNLSYFWLFNLNKQNIPQYIFLLNIPIEYKEVQEKWSELLANGRATAFTIESLEEDLNSIKQHFEQLTEEQISKLKEYGLRSLFNYSGKDFESYVEKHKNAQESAIKQKQLDFEEENYINNAKEARDKFKDKEFYKYLAYFTHDIYLSRFEECLEIALKNMLYANFKDTNVSIKDLVLQTLQDVDKKILLEILLIRTFNLAKIKNSSRNAGMSYASFVMAIFIESMYANISFLSNAIGTKLDYIPVGYFPERLSANVGLYLIECLNQTYEEIFEIGGSNKFSYLDIDSIGGAGQATFILKSSDLHIKEIIESFRGGKPLPPE